MTERETIQLTPCKKKKTFRLFLTVWIVSFLSQNSAAVADFLDSQHLLVWQCIGIVRRNNILMAQNGSSRFLPAIWHLVKSRLIQQSVRLLRAVYGACDWRRKYWISHKKKQKKIKQKLQMLYLELRRARLSRFSFGFLLSGGVCK